MRRHGFVEKDIEPNQVYEHIKGLLQSEGFKVGSEEKRDNFWDLHARKSSMERIVVGKVRDVDVIVAGTKGKFEVQLNAGVWGRDLAVPAIEGVATLGLATAVDLHSAHQFEERIWEQLVHNIDSSLKICQLDGLLFKSDQELASHIKGHEQQQTAQGSMMNSMLMMGMMGGVGMMGMGMMGGGLWI
ncbi:MAG: hypothetical protein ACYC7D_16030 [Nitrososphaerales archaeon]